MKELKDKCYSDILKMGLFYILTQNGLLVPYLNITILYMKGKTKCLSFSLHSVLNTVISYMPALVIEFKFLGVHHRYLFAY